MTEIKTILAAFSKHNDLLRELGYKDIKDYICPICLKHFSIKDTEKLSLEDAPTLALGGKKIAVTCKNVIILVVTRLIITWLMRLP